MKNPSILVLAAVLALTGCASVSRISTYGGGRGDAKFELEGRKYTISVHPKENMLLTQRSFGATIGKAAVRGVTWGLAEMRDSYAEWKGAFEHFVAPAGCTVSEVRPIDQDSTWEAAYQCPADVDLRRLILDQRTALREGAPLSLRR